MRRDLRGGRRPQRPPARTLEVEVVDVGWIDELTVPGRPVVHPVGARLLLRADVYRRARALRVENLARAFVRCEAYGRTYLHAVGCGGRLVRVETPSAPSRPGRLHVGARPHVPAPSPSPPPRVPRPRPARPTGPAEVRKGCGCGRKSAASAPPVVG